MADDLNDLFFDLRGAAESPFKEQPAESTVPATAPDPATTPPASTEPAQPAPVYLEDYDTPEEVENVLRAEWGPDFESKYEDASKAVQQFFKNDDESLQWLAARIGNHPMGVKLALRLAAIYSGNGLPEKSGAPNTAALDAEIREFQPGGRFYVDWISGDHALQQRRLALYSKRWPKKITFD